MAEHHSFRHGCRSGSVLQEGDLPALEMQVVPGTLTLRRDSVDRDPRTLREPQLVGVRSLGLFAVVGGAQDERWL